MGLWREILILAAKGHSGAARTLLAQRLPLSLRDFLPDASASRKYTGPVPNAVARFFKSLPNSERTTAESLTNDLVDYIVDDVTSAIERSLILVECCGSLRPTAQLDDFVSAFPWEPGLKRSLEWKRRRIADLLRSMFNAGIPLSEPVLTSLGNEGKARYEFSEIAYAVGSNRLARSWHDFKRRRRLDEQFRCVQLSDPDTGVAAETIDYGALTTARILLSTASDFDYESILDLHIAGEGITRDLVGLVEEMHERNPGVGYKPIAWHNVFWSISSTYEGLRLRLETREPFCERDKTLATHLERNYENLTATSRQAIQRRRRELYAACEERIQVHLYQRFGRQGEQRKGQITNISRGQRMASGCG